MSVDLFKYTVWNADTTGQMHPGSSSDIKCGTKFLLHRGLQRRGRLDSRSFVRRVIEECQIKTPTLSLLIFKTKAQLVLEQWRYGKSY